MIVRIATLGEFELGYVEPPEDWADRYPNWNDIHKTLDILHQDWFDANPEPDSDEEFIDYLIMNHGWLRSEHPAINHII